MIQAILTVFLAGIFTENMVLSKFMGICPFLGVSKKLNTAFGMSAAVIAVMFLATAVTWPVNKFLLEPFELEYLQTVVFILIIAALVQLLEIILKKFIPALHKSLGIYLPLITTNCAVLGIALSVQENGYDYITSLCSALGSGVGYMIAMIMFAGVRERLEKNDIPKALQGLPITLISASLVSLSFLGFSGLLDKLS